MIASTFYPVLADVPTSLLAARRQMALSLGFHIVLSCFGVAFPAMIWFMERRGERNDDPVATSIAKRWSKVSAVLFAVGAVSGTVLSFEMGLLWPGLMRTYGDVIGLPFALEGLAFFTEAIFLGMYLYGWNRMSPTAHRRLLIPTMISGVFGTFCILSVNAWMNSPSGFRLVNGKPTDIDPLAAMFNSAVALQFIHMWIGAFMVVGFVVAGVYAKGMLRGRNDQRHRLGFVVPFAFASIAACFQPLTGHLAGMAVADRQPAKLAAMELAVTTETPSPLLLGGVLIDGKVRWGIEIPKLGSLISQGSTSKPILGLNEFAADERPNDSLANIVHFAFQAMVAIGIGLMLLGAVYWIARRRGHDLLSKRWFLRVASVSGLMAVIALEVGWVTTEVGRQPWIVQGHMKVIDAVTPRAGVSFTASVLAATYLLLGLTAYLVLRSMSKRWRAGEGDDLQTPYGPDDSGVASVSN